MPLGPNKRKRKGRGHIKNAFTVASPHLPPIYHSNDYIFFLHRRKKTKTGRKVSIGMSLEGGINRFLSFLGLSCIFAFYGDPTSRPCASGSSEAAGGSHSVRWGINRGRRAERRAQGGGAARAPNARRLGCCYYIIDISGALPLRQALCTKRFMCII